MLQEFLHWWFGQLGAMAAPVLARFRQEQSASYRLSLDKRSATLFRLSDGEEVLLPLPTVGEGLSLEHLRTLATSSRSGRHSLSVSLAPDTFLFRRLRLPLAAKSSLAETIQYQVPLHTPFQADSCYYAYGAFPQEQRKDHIDIWLAVLPREPLHHLLEALGFPPSGNVLPARLPPGPDGALCITLHADRPAGPYRAARRFALAGLALLWLTAISLHLHNRNLEYDQLQQTLTELRSRAVHLQALQDRVDTIRTQLSRLATLRAETPEPSRLLAALTRTLDDQTWLQRLDLHDGRLALFGSSSRTGDLVTQLEALPELGDIQLDTSISAPGNKPSDHFQIKAKMILPGKSGA